MNDNQNDAKPENRSENNPEQEAFESWKKASYESFIMPKDLPPEAQTVSVEVEPEEPKIMNEKTRLGLRLLGIALIAGLAGDMLLRETPWGLNVLLWTSLVAASVIWIARRQNSSLLSEVKWLGIPVVFFAACFAWRDSAVLNLIAALSLLVALSLIVFRTSRGRLVIAGLVEYIEAGIGLVTFSSFGSLLLIASDVNWDEVPRDGWSRHASAIGRGLIIATPILIIFGGLLAGADAIFGNLLGRVFNFDPGRLVLHTFLTLLIACVVGGFLRILFVSRLPSIMTAQRPAELKLGIVEVGMLMGLLDVLFLAFVIVQFKYFFFGASHLPLVSGSAYSEYARSGFFELVTVTALVLPLLLATHWLLKKENPRHEMIFRVLAGIQIALLFVIMASAIKRMRMYQMFAGMTEQRFYTVAFMAWLALVFIWFSVTVLRGQRARFAFGAVVTGFAMVAGLQIVNPDNLIVRANLNRAMNGQQSDLLYTTSLSADSVPALMEGLGGLKTTEREFVINQIRQREWLDQSPDWRGWNLSRRRARHLSLMLPQSQANTSPASALPQTQ